MIHNSLKVYIHIFIKVRDLIRGNLNSMPPREYRDMPVLGCNETLRFPVYNVVIRSAAEI
jgi:hypothetical protein